MSKLRYEQNIWSHAIAVDTLTRNDWGGGR
jgi:hypothetical protein